VSSQNSSPMQRGFLICLVCVTVTLAIYVPHFGVSFAGLDVVTYEPVFNAHEFWGTALRILFDFKGEVVAGYYAPLSSVSMLADKFILGSATASPKFTHLIQLVLHCINGVLLFLLLTGGLRVPQWTAGLAAFFFLVHPVQVSSVMWFAERKNVLSALFFLTAYMSYFRFRSSGSRTWYGATVVVFVAGMLSKPVVAALPIILLLSELLGLHGRRALDDGSETPNDKRGSTRATSMRSLLVLIVPLCLIALGFGLLAIRTEGGDVIDLPLYLRPFVGAAAFWFYVTKIAAPSDLMHVYPRWNVDVSHGLWWIPLLAAVVLAAVLWGCRHRMMDSLRWACLTFLVTLLPVLGLFKFGTQQHSFVADHFLYLPMIGAALAISVGATTAFASARQAASRVLCVIMIALYASFLVAQASLHASVWESPSTLWKDNIEKCPTCWNLQDVMGVHLIQAGRPADAIPFFQRCLSLKPDYHPAMNHLAEAFMRMGRSSEAIRLFRSVLQTKPDYAPAHNNLGNALSQIGRTAEAIEHFRTCIAINPSLADPYNNLGSELFRAGKLEEATQNFRRAVERNPAFSPAHANLGLALMRSGQTTQAIIHLKRAVEIDPRLHLAHANLGRAYMLTGEYRAAVAHFGRALELRPAWSELRQEMEAALQKSGTGPDSIRH